MAKLMVMIDVPNASYDELREAMKSQGEIDGVSFVHSEVLVNSTLVPINQRPDDVEELVFELIGVRP